MTISRSGDSVFSLFLCKLQYSLLLTLRVDNSVEGVSGLQDASGDGSCVAIDLVRLKRFHVIMVCLYLSSCVEMNCALRFLSPQFLYPSLLRTIQCNSYKIVDLSSIYIYMYKWIDPFFVELLLLDASECIRNYFLNNLQ